NTGALIFGVGDEMNWLTTGETRNNLSGTMNLTLGTKFNLDATINRNSYNLDNRNSNYTYGTINLRTSFTNEFSTRLTYTFGEYNARLAENSFSFSNRQVGCFFTYNPSQNFYLSLGGTYDLQNSRMAYAQGDIRFRVGKYCYLRLAPFYDFVSKNTNYTIQVDPILSPLTP
ncbi:MAG TPA: hypothetical protein PL110_19970, partial [Candidatus Eremiobacteraeota bacterium]|nr:hypothetical protein [Candidatus Eremiobacteraeota bacterium]